MNMPLVSMNRRRRGGAASAPAFSPSALFALAEPGAWYDPSDLTTLFQDTAGTTPVTTPGQTVALALDKSKGLVLGSERVTNGDGSAGLTGWTTSTWTVNGSNQFTASSGNLEQSGVVTPGKWYIVEWDQIGPLTNTLNVFCGVSNITPFTVTSPAGRKSLKLLAAGDTRLIFQANGANTTIDNISVRELPGFHATQATLASRPTYGIVPLGGRRNLLLNTDTMTTQSRTVTAVAHTLSFTGTGTVTLTGASIAGPLIGTGAGNRVSLTFTPTAGSLTMTVVGSVTLAQLELGSTVTNYQRVGTSAFDVTEAGVASLSYLSFDGIDDHLVTPTVSFSTDKMTVFAGVRKLSDAALGMVVESSVDVSANNGSFWLVAPRSASATYGWRSKGSTAVVDVTSATSFAAPITNVVTGIGDISGDIATIRVNGAQSATSTADQGTGNYLAYPLYIGRRGGTSLPFNGQLYSLIVRNAATDAATITSSETWVAGKTGVTL